MATRKKKIVFVCTGNTCRSPMAQLLLDNWLKEQGVRGFEVRSAGIAVKKKDVINPKSAQVLRENGIECETFLSKKLTGKLLLDAFAVVCMTERQREYLMDMRWNALKKAGKSLDDAENNVYSFAEITGYEILDPYGKELDCYRYVFGLLVAGMSQLMEKFDLKGNTEKRKTKSSVEGKRAQNFQRKTSQINKKKTSTQTEETSVRKDEMNNE